MSPKSLLRHKDAVSTLEELAEGRFHTVLDETSADIDKKKVDRIVLCSGKVYYDLADKRQKEEASNVAIVRIEQLYPFPEEQLLDILSQYKKVKDIVWCQEEPMNQGAWYSSQHHMRRVVSRVSEKLYLRYAGRDASASPAAGYMSLHLEQLEQFLNDAILNIQ